MGAMTRVLPYACSRIRGNSDFIEDVIWMFTYNSENNAKKLVGRYIKINDLFDISRKNINKMRDFSISTVNEQMKAIYRLMT